jgi:translation elongation factor P/translation initiation factor 5A
MPPLFSECVPALVRPITFIENNRFPGLLSAKPSLPSTLRRPKDGAGVNLKIFMASANDLRKGMAISYNGDVSVVLDTQHRTPGNLRAFVQASLRSLKTGKTSDVRFSSTEKIEVVPMMTRKMDFSYKDGEDFVFSDPETYETTTLTPEIGGRRQELPGGKRLGHGHVCR